MWVAKQCEANKRTCSVCGVDYYAFPSASRSTCGKKECVRTARGKSNRRHGESDTRLHSIWYGMNSRCRNHIRYKHLSVCDEWKSYEAFRDWAHATGYEENLEIDRKENSLGYSPDNCRWATRVQQMQNTGLRKQKNKTSKFKGVQKMKLLSRKQWRANGTENSKPKHLGLFETEIEAAMAYDVWAKKQFGEFACLNFKED